MLLQGLDAASRKQRVAETLEQVGLKEYADRRPNKLSGGQQQRVAVARAMASHPDIILADEPTGNLDPVNKRNIMDLLFRETETRNQTLIVVTHDQSLLDDFDRVIDFETFLQTDDLAQSTSRPS